MNREKLFRRYLDGELSPEEEKEALHVIADDDELRSMLRFEQKLNEIGERGSPFFKPGAVPAGFSDSVMSHIRQMEEEAAEKRIFRNLKEWYRQLWIPRKIRWRPVYAFAFAVLVMASLIWPVFLVQNFGQSDPQALTGDNVENSVQQVSSTAGEVMLRFVYVDEDATSIAVAGDFSDWKTIELSEQNVNGKQVWTGLISMSRGEHSYMFVRNGSQWITDPLAPVQRDDGFGNKNAVIYL